MRLLFQLVLTMVACLSFILTTGQTVKKPVRDSIDQSYPVKMPVADSMHYSITIRKGPVRYPKEAEKNKIQGSVTIGFDIDSNCKCVNIKIIKSLGYGCDEEAIRWVRAMVVTGDPLCQPRRNMQQTIKFVIPEE